MLDPIAPPNFIAGPHTDRIGVPQLIAQRNTEIGDGREIHAVMGRLKIAAKFQASQKTSWFAGHWV